MKTKRFAIALGAFGIAGAIAAGAIALKPEWLPAGLRLGARAAEASSEDYGLYCQEHGVPEKFCTLCHDELRDSLLLCPEHGDIPEDICVKCHPEVEKKYDIEMCPNGHGLPKHFCIECGIETTAAPAPNDGWCAAHNRPEALCPECSSAGLKSGGSTVPDCCEPLPIVRLARPSLAGEIGLETAPVVEERHAHHVEALAETAYNGNRHAEIFPRVTGYLESIEADLGDKVEAGDVLAVVDSAEVSSAKTRYLSARATLDLASIDFERTESLYKQKAVASQRALEARTALNQAEAELLETSQTLRNLGFDERDLKRIEGERDTSSRLEILAPIDGVVVFRHAVQGEAVQPTTKLFGIADTEAMWLWIDLYEPDVPLIELGQTVTFQPSTSARALAEAEGFQGRITWVGSEVDERTRTTKVRAVLESTGGRLRANLFGQAKIQVEPEHDAVMIPKAALQRHEGADLVFLPIAPGRYRPQRVQIRPTDRPETVEVTWGLEPGDEVVTEGGFLLKTEILRGAIGAGCCE